jgi:hypothetical protein
MNLHPKIYQKLPLKWNQKLQVEFEYEGGKAKQNTKDLDATKGATKLNRRDNPNR